jgi:putative nucleotidyltransferase with HDIG domain
MSRTSRQRPVSVITAVLFCIALAALLVVALFPIFPDRLDIRVGDTASRSVQSPRNLTFESAFRTEQDREAAAAAVPLAVRYDDRVRAAQVVDYDELTAQIQQVRALPDDARKRDALAALRLSSRSVESAIVLPEDRWTTVREEGRRVLNDSLSVSLDSAAATEKAADVDAAISPDFLADEALLAAELVRPLIIPTLAIDEAETDRDRQAERDAVAPHGVTVLEGADILKADEVVDAEAIEKLREAGLLSRSVEWRNVVAVAIIAAVAALAISGYLLVLQPRGVTSERHLIALGVVTMLPLLVAKFYLPIVLPDDERQFLAFMLPVAVAPLLVASLLNTELGVVVSALAGALMAFISTILPDVSLVASLDPLDTFRLMLVYGLGPIAGVYIVHRADRLNRYLSAGIAVGLISYALLVATWFVDGDRELGDLAWMAFATGIGGVSAGVLAAGAFVTAGMLFGVTTRVQLMELSQLNAPLLRRLQDEAPGTFHHSVIVGNLAERAADLVGADALLTRVGCYYHDIGKVLQPGMYIENQSGGPSPHEDMSPEESAEVIQQHVSRGLALARRSRLPARVQAFIPEHHGTRLVAYFYRIAAERDPMLDPASFQYPGPRPQSKETAIVMLADSTEAVIRSSDDRSPERIDQLVEEVIAERLGEGQLDDSDLTLRDVRTIAESFKGTMRAVYHPRVAYPQPAPMEARRRMLRLPLRSSPRDDAKPVLPNRRRRT